MASVLLCQGTALALPLKDASVSCCVTSPPYYGLRDYGTGTWQGGDGACTHAPSADKIHRAYVAGSTLQGGKATQATAGLSPSASGYAGVCGRCGATRVDAQLGLEETVEEYVAAMVQVFREVKRVLHPTGTCWVVLGDSYNAAGRNGHGTRIGYKQGTNRASATGQDACRPTSAALGEKQLLGMPWRLAFALQQDGWVLRSDIIWDKPSCMPESVQDRPTRSHEYVFLFSKQAQYHYDAEAIKEPQAESMLRRTDARPIGPKMAREDCDSAEYPKEIRILTGGRNARTVWRIASEPFSGSHFATFPQALVRRCLLAGAPSQVCAACGTPYRRVVERQPFDRAHDRLYGNGNGVGHNNPSGAVPGSNTRGMPDRHATTLGFSPTCACQHASMPCTVLDPFCGSGTTLLVARELGHHAVGIDLSAEYLRNIARVRLGLTALKEWQDGAAPRQDRFDDLPLFGPH